MATALEVYGAHTETEASHTGDTNYVQYLRCTVDRSAKAGTKNFFVIAHIGIQVADAANTKPLVKLEQDDTTVIGEVEGLVFGDTQVGTFNHGFTYNFVRRISLDNSSHTFDLDYKTSDATDTVYTETASIVVIEESANAEYAEQIAEVGSDSDSVWTKFVDLVFTPGSEQQYVVFGAAEIELNDESDTFAQCAFRKDTTIFCGWSQGYAALIAATNDDKYFTVGCAAIWTLLTQEYSIDLAGRGAGLDNVKCKRAAIVAIPVGDFENVYSDSQAGNTEHAGTDYTDSDCSMSQAVNAAEHLILAGWEISNSSANYTGNAQLIADTVTSWCPNFDDRDGDPNGWYMQMVPLLLDLGSGTKTFKIQGRDSLAAKKSGLIGEAYLIVIEIPSEEAPEGWTNIASVMGVGQADLASFKGVAKADIASIKGVAV